MPVMFFLAGSVLAGSALSGSALSGSALSGPGGNGSGPIAYARRLARRLGRLLIPFWVYSLGLLCSATCTCMSIGLTGSDFAFIQAETGSSIEAASNTAQNFFVSD